MKAVVVTLDPETLEPDRSIEEAVREALSGQIRVQLHDASWDFDVTPIIDGNGRNARIGHSLAPKSGQRSIWINYERQDGTPAMIRPRDELS